MAEAGRGPSTLTGGRQQEGVTQGHGPAEVRIVKQLQGCGKAAAGASEEALACPQLPKVQEKAWPSLLGHPARDKAENQRSGPGRGRRRTRTRAHRGLGQLSALASAAWHLCQSQPMASLRFQVLMGFLLLLGGYSLLGSLHQASRHPVQLISVQPLNCTWPSTSIY